MLTQEYSVVDYNIPTLIEQIAKLNKKAKKLGVPAIVLTISEQPTKVIRDTWDRIKRAYYTATVTGEAPKMDGWRLLAVLAPIESGDTVLNLVKEVPGSVCPAEYREVVGICTHCNKTRRRNETFVVQHDDGRTECVGRSCIKDFLGHADPHKYASWATLLFEAISMGDKDPDEYWGCGERPDPSHEIMPFLAWTASVVDHMGWKAKSQCQDGEASTCGTVCWLLGRIPENKEERQAWEDAREKCNPTDEHKKQAQDAVEWVKTLDPGTNNYLFNIQALGNASLITLKNTGLAASIIQAYRKHLGFVAESKKQVVSNYFGEIKVRAEYTLTLIKEQAFESDWGTSFMERFLDEAGNVAIWWASSCPEQMKIGETYKVKATVKAHSEYQGVKQTVLTRVSIV